MPTYQYACTACGHRLEAVQSFADESLTECPACEGRLRKLYSGVGIVFKGSGFYRTDSRTAANGNGASPAKESSSAGSSDGASSTTSDSTSTSGATSTSVSATTSSASSAA